jgi:hypothetical protein
MRLVPVSGGAEPKARAVKANGKWRHSPDCLRLIQSNAGSVRARGLARATDRSMRQLFVAAALCQYDRPDMQRSSWSGPQLI